VLAGLRADHAHEARSATLTGSAAAVPLLTTARGAALRAEALLTATFLEWLLDEREAALTVRASRRRGERITLVHLDWRADVRTAWIDVDVVAGIGRLRRPRTAGARSRISSAGMRRTTRVPAATRAPSVVADLDSTPAVEQ
jgi:hypothetical protein